MPTIVIQIVWSFIHRIRLKLLLIILGCGVAFSVLRFLSGLGYPIPDSLKFFCPFGLQLLLGLTLFITYYTTEFSKKVGFPSRMYVLPAKTSLLVSAQMLSGILAGILIYLVVAGMARTILGAKWPLLGPSFFLAIFLAWNMTIAWSAPGLSIVKTLPAVLIWATLLVWIGKRFGIDSMPMNPSKMWMSVTLGELLTMTLLGVGAYFTAIVAVSLDRCGDSPVLAGIEEWLEKDILVRNLRNDRGFSSPAAAQLWFEMRSKGHLIPIANVFIQLLLLVAYLCGKHDGLLIVASVFVPVGCPYFLGLMAGSCGRPHEPAQMDSFRAIRPMSSQALAHVMLMNGGLNVLLTWSGWLVSLLLFVVCIYIKGHAGEVFGIIASYYARIGLARLVFIIFFIAILSWTTMAIAASRAMAGSRWIRWLSRLGILVVSLFLFYFHAHGMITPAQYAILIKIFCWLVGIYCSLRTIMAFYQARSRRLIGDRMIGFAITGWTGLCFISGYALWGLWAAGSTGDRLPQELIPLYSVAFMLAGLLMLPLAPLATAPLALTKSRSN